MSWLPPVASEVLVVEDVDDIELLAALDVSANEELLSVPCDESAQPATSAAAAKRRRSALGNLMGDLASVSGG